MNPISNISSFVSSTTPLPPLSPGLGKGAKAAREFEAQLIGSVLQSLEQTMASLPGQNAAAGQDDYNYLGTQALASAIAARGGFGIARMIEAHLPDTKVANRGLTALSLSETDGH